MRTAIGVGCAAAVLAAPAALAGGREDVEVAGRCTGPSSAELKLSEENGRVEVEFEVDQNRNGVRWNVVLRRAGRVVHRSTRVTRGPSGSFEARVVVRGGGRFAATATRRGERCTASARW